MINFGLIKSHTCKEIEINVENCSEIEAEILFRSLDNDSFNFESILTIFHINFDFYWIILILIDKFKNKSLLKFRRNNSLK